MYAGTEFLTGNEIATALMKYSQALAEVGQAETVAVPAVEKDGSVIEVMVLIGPASQIVALDTRSELAELVDHDVVAQMTAKSRKLTPTAVVDTDPPLTAGWDEATLTDGI